MYKFNNKKSLVFGIGINDLDRPVVWKDKGKRILCPIYRIWQNMLCRCYDESYVSRQPSYSGCIVIEDWLYLSR